MFEGVMTALITPFRDGAIDEEALRGLVERQIEAGVDGLVPCGSTGESATLSHDEHNRVVEITIEATAGRVPVRRQRCPPRTSPLGCPSARPAPA